MGKTNKNRKNGTKTGKHAVNKSVLVFSYLVVTP